MSFRIIRRVSLPLIFLLLTMAGGGMAGCGREKASGVSVAKSRKYFLEEWSFQPDILDIGEQERWYDTILDHRPWRKVKIPGAWDTYDDALWGYEGAAWYAAVIPAGMIPQGKEVFLHFGRVNYYAKVWVNGIFVGEHVGGYLPFGWDVTRYLRENDNLVVVRVDNRLQPGWLPAARQVEWVQYGGLLQPVQLIFRESLRLGETEVYARPVKEGAEVSCRVMVHNDATAGREVTVRIHIAGEGQATEEMISGLCPAGERKPFTCSLTLPGAKSWSPGDPQLYSLTLSLLAGDTCYDRRSVRFGVREIRLEGRRIVLNGKPFRIRGVNRYDIFGRQGPVWDTALIRQDLLRIKRTGANAVRVHYPQSPLTLDLLDETGLLLIEEIPLNWWGQNWWGGETVAQDTTILQQARRTLREMIRRDRNHPCILAWSVANECRTETKEGNYVVSELIREAHQLDTTRPVTFTVNNETALHQAFRLADIVSCNVYYGNDKAFHISQMDSLVRQPAEAYLRRQLSAYPGKPLLVTELGGGGIYGVTGDAPFSEEYQAAYIAKMWEAISNVPQCSGGILWCWRDYFHRKYFTTTYAPFGPYGVLNTAGEPKRSFDTLQKIFGGNE